VQLKADSFLGLAAVLAVTLRPEHHKLTIPLGT